MDEERPARGSIVSGEIAVRSPAKINWTLDVLGRRGGGYHEVRTILQTIALSDTVTVAAADGLELQLSGPFDALRNEDSARNLAHRAAQLLRDEYRVDTGALIKLEKRIPVAAGLGGGSSNAAATLRALRSLWRLSLTSDELAAMAAKLGSDVPFFLTGGTALGSGRGDEISPLPDALPQRLVVAWPDLPARDKTAQAYAALKPEHYSDGTATERLAERLSGGGSVANDDLHNVFEPALPSIDATAGLLFADAHALGRPHLAGSGPAFFFLLAQAEPAEPIIQGLTSMGLDAIETHTIAAAEATESL